MERPQRMTHNGPKITFISKFTEVFFDSDGYFHSSYQIFGQGGDGSNRRAIVCLGLLNVVLLIAAVALGINCSKVKEGSLHVSHPAATQLINELNYLRSNNSDAMKAQEEAKQALQKALKNHAQLKVQIEQQKTINDGYHRQVEVLRAEKANLQANISALEGTCGRCLAGWSILNSTCYFFSYTESSSVKKNWFDSRADCISRDANLVVIDNPEEQRFLSDSIKNKKTSSKWWENGFWIGITDMETEGTWVWINNVTEVENRYWMDGEPNNLGHHGENCGVAVYSPTNPWKTWFDGFCSVPLHWICEMPSK
ncbi:CD209 antigen-like [Toxotes jaculatrix]|uniref:CD209 antigen-like n=1 Tax=Toxotes jaculatrix TaxID=941984 RepID=UPI001B3ABA53|nr:CD209 antigen-like [Toxotes jaculatrix]